MKIEHPYLMFLGNAHDDLAAKTARGIVHWRSEWCLGQISLEGCQTTLSLPEMALEDAIAAGCKTMVLGVANRGGVIPDTWIACLCQALDGGLDIANGLHKRLVDMPEVVAAAERGGRNLFDVRHTDRTFSVGTGEKRSGQRLLTVGTDVSVGKMYTALSIELELKERGVKADFRATGQTGILIAGDGVAIDAVVSDFVSGVVEELAPANDKDHWDLVEGQGSLYHPSYAGVTMGLLHGAQADALVLCHEPTRTHMRGLPHQELPGLQQCMEGHVEAARLTNPAARCVGVAINTSGLATEEEHRRLLGDTADQLGLPCVDPVRDGVAPIVDNLM